ncbi:HPr family phosphocarrier protein [Defluviitalea phaphyphila]|uniref:HPr family phosphocarrier protein n=1 Tax=Defluviitalea phaphyphila TaxID=1473580 RepID=UPI0007319E06|nr:HPr family phosphocarrier protein [Defluviitalea phaphyphila]
MKSIKISLNSIEKVKKFVNIIGKYEGDFDLSSGRYKVDAKSIMGIFSLDLSSPLQLDIHNDAVAEDVIAEINKYIEQ